MGALASGLVAAPPPPQQPAHLQVGEKVRVLASGLTAAVPPPAPTLPCRLRCVCIGNSSCTRQERNCSPSPPVSCLCIACAAVAAAELNYGTATAASTHLGHVAPPSAPGRLPLQPLRRAGHIQLLCTGRDKQAGQLHLQKLVWRQTIHSNQQKFVAAPAAVQGSAAASTSRRCVPSRIPAAAQWRIKRHVQSPRTTAR